MDGAELVHMVALVRAAAGVHKREHTGNQQGRFVMRHRIWAGEYGAGLTVFSLAVAEEERVGGGIPVPELAGLAHEAAGQKGIALDLAAGAEDEKAKRTKNSRRTAKDGTSITRRFIIWIFLSRFI